MNRLCLPSAFILFSLFMAVFPLHAEQFRTSSIIPYEVTVSHTSEKPEPVVIGINDALEIGYPRDNPYIKGLEIEIRIPKIIASYRDSEVFYLFENVHPAAGGDQYDYEGKRLYKDLIPSRLSYIFRIPFEGETFTEASPYASVLPVALNKAADNLVLRTQLAMKGVPDTYFEARFEVIVQPVLADMGSLSLELIYPEGTDLTEFPLPLCYIDEKLAATDEPVLLKTGMHHLSVISEQYRNEMRTFSIEKAAETSLQIVLQPVTTDITIQAPEGTVITLDGEPVESHRVIPVEAGEHLISYRLADYEVTKHVTVVRGKSYTVSLAVDVSVFEQEY